MVIYFFASSLLLNLTPLGDILVDLEFLVIISHQRKSLLDIRKEIYPQLVYVGFRLVLSRSWNICLDLELHKVYRLFKKRTMAHLPSGAGVLPRRVYLRPSFPIFEGGL